MEAPGDVRAGGGGSGEGEGYEREVSTPRSGSRAVSTSAFFGSGAVGGMRLTPYRAPVPGAAAVRPPSDAAAAIGVAEASPAGTATPLRPAAYTSTAATGGTAFSRGAAAPHAPGSAPAAPAPPSPPPASRARPLDEVLDATTNSYELEYVTREVDAGSVAGAARAAVDTVLRLAEARRIDPLAAVSLRRAVKLCMDPAGAAAMRAAGFLSALAHLLVSVGVESLLAPPASAEVSTLLFTAADMQVGGLPAVAARAALAPLLTEEPLHVLGRMLRQAVARGHFSILTPWCHLFLRAINVSSLARRVATDKDIATTLVKVQDRGGVPASLPAELHAAIIDLLAALQQWIPRHSAPSRRAGGGRTSPAPRLAATGGSGSGGGGGGGGGEAALTARAPPSPAPATAGFGTAPAAVASAAAVAAASAAATLPLLSPTKRPGGGATSGVLHVTTWASPPPLALA